MNQFSTGGEPHDPHKLVRVEKYLSKHGITLTPWQAEILGYIARMGRGAGTSYLIEVLHDMDKKRIL